MKAENLAKSWGRALGSVILTINTNKSVGFQTYKNLFFFAPFLNYNSGIRGYVKHHCIEKPTITSRCSPVYYTVRTEKSSWLSSKCRHGMNMLRFWTICYSLILNGVGKIHRRYKLLRLMSGSIYNINTHECFWVS